MEFTYEELREEEKRNIEIIESCEKIKNEIDENIKNVNSIINKIKNQGELDKQIEEINKQINAFDKDNNEQAKEILSMRKERLSELKTLLVLNRNGNESDIQMLQREIAEFKQQKSVIEEEQKNAIKIMENIVEICNEHIAELDNERNSQNNKSEKMQEITQQYAKLEEELESYKIYGSLLTKKQQKRISEIETEKDLLEKQMIEVLPDFRQTIVNKTKKSQLDLLFGVAQIQEGKALDRKATIINSYQKVADETNKYLEENVKKQLKKDQQSEIIPEPKESKELESQNETEKKDEIITKDLPPFDIINKQTGIEKSETFMVKEDKPKEKIKKITNDNWNKNEKDEIEYFFGRPIEIEENEEKKPEISERQTENLEHDENNIKEIKSDESLTNKEIKNDESEKIEEKKQTKEPENETKKTEIKPNVSFESEFPEFARIINSGKKEEIEENEAQNVQDDTEAMNDYIKEIKKEAEELEIDKKIKRKVEKDKKKGRIKRFFTNIKNYFFEEDELDEIQLETSEEKEKGGRTK